MEDQTSLPNIVLVGFMGTGKSALGRKLARRLRRVFVDTDATVESLAGCSIRELFARDGEEAFRDLETAAAEEVSRMRGCVVATGGGIVGRDENIRLLRTGGVLICLESRPEIIVRRTQPWTSRPMLRSAPNPYQAVVRLMEERSHRYALADWSLDTSDRKPQELLDEICAKLPSLYPLAGTRS